MSGGRIYRGLIWIADLFTSSGTFSTVYKAIDVAHHNHNNEYWCPATVSRRKLEENRPVYVALKRIYVTSSPNRILNELQIMASLR